MERIDIAIDFGGSGLKVVASCGDKLAAFRISPQVAEISDPKYLEQEFSIDLTKNLWVGAKNTYYALGALAADRYYAPVPLVEPKRTYVIPRTLGAVAVAAHRFGIKKFKVNLQLLLPAAEFSKEDKQKLGEDLVSALASFETPLKPMKAKALNITAKPEGFGLMRRKMVVGGSEYQVQSTAVVMFGHRNTSLYLSSGGEQRDYRSNSIGFIRAIESANVDQVKAIANPALIDKASIKTYWDANRAWLRENWPKSATTAIIGGGPIAVIGDLVTAYLNELMESNRLSYKKITFANAGMPLTKYEESHWKPENDPYPLLSAWPEDMGIAEEDKRQFADVYCLWATNEVTRRAGTLA
jgi:hypothetical protein